MDSKPPFAPSGCNRELLLTMVENMPIAAVVIDGDSLYCNSSAERLTGYLRAEVSSFSEWLKKLFGSDHAAMGEQYEKDKAAGFSTPRELMITCKDGSCRIVEFAATGREQIFCVMHDLTERVRAEQIIRDNETLLREAQRIGNLGIFNYDIVNDCWTSSKEMDMLFGIDDSYPKTFSTWLAINHPDCRDEMEQYVTALMVSKQRFDMEYRIVRPCDGQERWVYGTGEFSWDSAGRPLRMIGTIQDITGRKKTEQLLLESEERYRRFSSITSDYVYSCRRSGRDPFHVQWMAGAIETITGYSSEQIYDWGCWLPLVHPEDRNRVKNSLFEIEAGDSITDEFRIIRKDGAIRWIHEACSCERGASPGELILFGTSRDITRKKEAEEALREVETVFNLFLEYSPVYVFFKDENIRATRLSRNFETMLGRPLDQIIGKSMEELFPGDFAGKMVADDRKVLRDGVPIQIEEEFQGNTYKTLKFPIQLEGHSPLLAGFTIDITDLKEAQKAVMRLNEHLERLVAERTADLEKSNEELASFCYTVSHELRAPIARLQGLSSILEDVRKESDEASFIASRIAIASRQLQSVVDAILMLSRLSRVELSLQPVDLSGMAKRKVDLLLAENPGRRVELVINPGVKAVADPSLMEICLDNLLGNAFKYTGQSAQARIEFGVCNDSGNEVYFVRDNGAGFDMTYSEKLYLPFQRLHQHHEFPGVGIGLATVKRIIERHGGELWADSAVGEGATFYFTLGGTDAAEQG